MALKSLKYLQLLEFISKPNGKRPIFCSLTLFNARTFTVPFLSVFTNSRNLTLEASVLSAYFDWLMYLVHQTPTSRRKHRTHLGLILIDLYMLNKLLTENAVLLNNLSCCLKAGLKVSFIV